MLSRHTADVDLIRICSDMRFVITPSYLAVLLQLFSSEIGESLSCQVEPQNVCVCKGNNYTLDLRAAFSQHTSQNVSDSDIPGNSYVISPCVNFTCGGKPSRVCQWDSQSKHFNVIGTVGEVKWDVQSTKKFIVTFGDGDKLFNNHSRNANITCQIGEPKYSFVGEGDPNTDDPLVYKFKVSAPNFDPISPTQSGGTSVGVVGLVIMIVLFLAIVLYFIIGSVVMYTAKGARGVEMIPNYTFWRDLPFLIKDGGVFTFGPCVNKIRDRGGYSAL